MKQFAVIMAGGVGTRFWPQSREAYPKQFLTLFGNRSLIQQTVDRISKLIPFSNILIITNKRYISLVQEQLPELPIGNILGEPLAKNTAPCVALAAEIIFQRDENSVMTVLPADHIIENETEFLEVLKKAQTKAEELNSIVTIGITPSHPETGYGYIQFDDNSTNNVKPVLAFKEKPDLKTAQEFLNKGNFLWNSGMFVWSVNTIRNAFKSYQPELFDLACSNLASLDGSVTGLQLASFFEAAPSISVDYAILEKAKQVFVVPADFGWNDVGSWSAVYELNQKDENGNVDLSSISSLINSKNSYISSKSGKIIALVGMDDTAVIETDDAILICKISASQDVKKVVESLKEHKSSFK